MNVHIDMQADLGAADYPRKQGFDLPSYDAVDLTKGGRLAQIVLLDQVYSLRITRFGKLILTK